MSEEERHALRRFLTVSALRGALGVSAVIMLAGLIIWMALNPDRAFSGVWLVALPVLALWAWLFLPGLRAAWQARSDLAAGAVEEIRGRVEKERRPRPGLFAPSAGMLIISGRRFRVPETTFRAVPAGSLVRARHGAASGALLSWSEAGAETASTAPPPDRPETLTPREEELLDLIAEGLSDKEIARALNLSPATVRGYNSDLYAKLGVSRRTQAAAFARRGA